MEAMRLAFHKTCKALQLSDIDDAFTDIVATSIVELAKTGERDRRIVSVAGKFRGQIHQTGGPERNKGSIVKANGWPPANRSSR
jgi:hypothetical protein